MNIIAWLILGAIAGYLAGFLVKGDEGYGVIGHVVLGIVGALVGGFLASLLFNVSDPIQGAFNIGSIVVSVIGAIIAVVVFNLVTGRTRTGRGAIAIWQRTGHNRQSHQHQQRHDRLHECARCRRDTDLGTHESVARGRKCDRLLWQYVGLTD